MLTTDNILDGLEARGVRNVDLARALGWPESRATELRKRRRALKHDEAVKLVEEFSLEGQAELADPLPIPVARLAVLHIVKWLGAELPDDQLQDLSADIAALAALAADPAVRVQIDALETYLRGQTIRRRPAALLPAPRRANNH